MQRPRMLLESLEAREVPAAFGTPWYYGDMINVSFAPDAAKVSGVGSTLKARMNALGLSDAVWQKEVLRAFQTWAAVAKINFGLVADTGVPIGTTGAAQFDPRFGDIRLFAVPLSSNVLAITTPPDPTAGTRAGDIILNANKVFTVGTGGQYDLYTVMLQEIGHAIGISNSTDPASPMYEFYNGPKAGLTAGDVSAVQAMYGTRTYNQLEMFGNGSASSATTISNAGQLADGTIVTLIAETASATDDDWYKFTVPTGVSRLTVELQAGVASLVQGSIQVLNASQAVVGSASATGAGKDAAVSLTNLVAGQTYYVRVADVAGTSFAVGLYRLRLVPPTVTGEDVNYAGAYKSVDSLRNEALTSATTLYDANPFDAKRSYFTLASLSENDADFYKVRSSLGSTVELEVLTATLRLYDGTLTPTLTVYNAQGQTLPAVVRADGKGFYAVEVDGALPDTDYYVAVKTRSGVVLPADYKLDVSFRNRPREMDPLLSGSFHSSGTAATTLTVGRSIEMALDFTAVVPNGGTATMSIYNSSGRVVYSLVVRDGDIVTGCVLLNAGTYTVKFTSSVTTGTTLVALRGAVLTDPIGVTAVDSTTTTVTDYTITTTGTGSSWLDMVMPGTMALV